MLHIICHYNITPFFLDFSASNHHYNISHENASFFFTFHKKCKVSQIPKKASPLVKKIKICLYYLILKGDTFFILGVTFCHQMIFKGDTFNFKDFVKIRPMKPRLEIMITFQVMVICLLMVILNWAVSSMIQLTFHRRSIITIGSQAKLKVFRLVTWS